MRQKFKISFFMVLVFIANSYCGHAQIKKENLKLGFTYGTGSQNKFPFNDSDYTHEVMFYKTQIKLGIRS